MNLKKIIKEEMDDLQWIKDIDVIPRPENNDPWILVVDTLANGYCEPQEYLFRNGYKWASITPSIHGEPRECHHKPINKTYTVYMPNQGKVNYNNGERTFGHVGWYLEKLNDNGKDEFMSEYMKENNPHVYLWSNIINKEPEFNFYDTISDDVIKEEMDDLQWIRDTNPKLLPENFRYVIILCDTKYSVENLRTKFIELFGTDYSDNRTVVNWFDNNWLKRYESEYNGVLLGLTRNNGKLYGGWDICDELMGYYDYEQLTPEDFLNLYNLDKKTPR
jgi:hypothetical protein